MNLIENIIRAYVVLGKRAATGFEPTKCPICHDYKARLGIKFENETIGVNCFNCGFDARYNEGDTSFSEKFEKMLKGFCIPQEELDKALGEYFVKAGGLKVKKAESREITLESLSKKEFNFSTPEIELPKGSKLVDLENPTNEEINIIEYLLNRKIDLFKYRFFHTPERPNEVIIPYYRNGRIIYWQSRAISGDSRYDGPSRSKESVFFNYDELHKNYNLPLFVLEGAFDAMSIDGIALIGSKLNETKTELLNRCKRRKIFVLDKDKNGRKLGLEVIEYGWDVAFCPDGYRDVNKAIQETSRLWTIKSIMDSIPTTLTEAKIAITLNCREG